MNGIELSPLESRFLAAAADPKVTRRRIRLVIFFGLIAAGGVVLLAASGESIQLVAGLAVAYVLITLYEKVAYGNGVLVYKALIRKLVTRIEELESQQGRAS